MKPSFMILQDEKEAIDSEKQHKRITQKNRAHGMKRVETTFKPG